MKLLAWALADAAELATAPHALPAVPSCPAIARRARALLAQMCEGRLMPTPWLNQARPCCGPAPAGARGAGVFWGGGGCGAGSMHLWGHACGSAAAVHLVMPCRSRMITGSLTHALQLPWLAWQGRSLMGPSPPPPPPPPAAWRRRAQGQRSWRRLRITW